MRYRAPKLPDCTCEVCGYSWTPRKENPKSCPECKTRNWKKEEEEAK